MKEKIKAFIEKVKMWFKEIGFTNLGYLLAFILVFVL